MECGQLYSIFRAFFPGHDSGRIIESYVHLLPDVKRVEEEGGGRNSIRGWTTLGNDIVGAKIEGARRRYIYRLNRVFASGSVCHKFGWKIEKFSNNG